MPKLSFQMPELPFQMPKLLFQKPELKFFFKLNIVIYPSGKVYSL
jgi:hypothetical protein